MSNLFILCFAQLRKSPNEAVLELEQHTYKRKNDRHFNHYCLCESRISFEAFGSSPVIPDSKMDNQGSRSVENSTVTSWGVFGEYTKFKLTKILNFLTSTDNSKLTLLLEKRLSMQNFLNESSLYM